VAATGEKKKNPGIPGPDLLDCARERPSALFIDPTNRHTSNQEKAPAKEKKVKMSCYAETVPGSPYGLENVKRRRNIKGATYPPAPSGTKREGEFRLQD